MSARAFFLRNLLRVDGDVLSDEARLRTHDLEVRTVIEVHLVLAARVRAHIHELRTILEHRDHHTVQFLGCGHVLHGTVHHHIVHLSTHDEAQLDEANDQA